MFAIFNTSRCGSTLLTCLLSKSVTSYSEPDWLHEICDIQDMSKKIEMIKQFHKPNTLIKYSSMHCDVAPHLDCKKVFLYRNFDDHLKKLNPHPQTKHYEATFWNERFTHMLKSQDVLFIESNYFLNNQQEIAKKVCNHFNIEYVPIEINFHVKDAGYLHTNTPIDIKK